MGFVRQLVMSFLWIGVLRAQEDRDKYFNVTLPSTITAQEGLCVLIPCTFTYEKTVKAAVSSRGYWFFEGAKIQEKAVATNDVNKEIHEHTRGRFRLVGDVRSRDCSLSINDVRKSDAGSYIFKYEHNERSTTKYSYIRYPLCVTVTDLQDKPEMSLPEQVMEGEWITVQCTAPGRCSGTAPNFTWAPESQFKYHQLCFNTDNPDGTRTYTSTIIFTALRVYNNSRLHCTAYFPAVDKYTTASITLTVEYPPGTPQTNENATKLDPPGTPQTNENATKLDPPGTPQTNENATTLDTNSSILPLMAMIGVIVEGAVVLAGLFVLAWLMVSKVRRNRTMNKTSNDMTIDHTYQELQRRQSDTYSELKRDGK